MTRRSRIDRLINRALDGDASVAQAEELARIAREDRAVRDEIKRGTRLLDTLRTLPLEPPRVDLVARARAESRRRPVRRPRWSPLPFAVGTLAAGVAALCVVVLSRTEMPVVRAADVRGVVWITRGDESRQLSAGDLVASGSHLETTAAASVRLAAGDAVSILLEPSSWLGVGFERESHVTVTVEGGSIEVEVGGGAPLEIRLRGSLHHVVIRTGKARVLHDKVDRAVVACLSGSAMIDAEQILSAGQEIELRPGAGTGPRPLPDALALDAAPPARAQIEVQGEVQRITVSGRTNPGAHVFVNGERARVDDAGEFEHTIELAKGERRIEIEARDVIGRERKMTVALNKPATPKRRPPQTPIETEWQWEDPPGEGPG